MNDNIIFAKKINWYNIVSAVIKEFDYNGWKQLFVKECREQSDEYCEYIISELIRVANESID